MIVINSHKTTLIFLLLTSFLILTFGLVYSEPFNFGNPQNLSNGNLENSQFVEIASFESNVFVTWMNVTSNNQIYFTKSTDNGTSFSTPVELTGGANLIRDPKIVINNNDNVYVSWIDDDNAIPEIITSTDNGTSFDSVVDIGADLPSVIPDQIRLAANNGAIVYVVWLDDDGLGNIETFLRRSIDNGSTFGSTIPISNGDSFASSPQVITNGDTNVYVVWQNDPLLNGFDDIFFSASTDSGSSFPVSEFLISDSSSLAQMPQIATGNTTNVYVIWQQFDGTREQILFSSSTNNGTSFGIGQVSISNSTGSTGSTSPQIAASGNNVYVVWQDDSDGDDDIYFRSSANNGTSFTPALTTLPLNISSNTGTSTNPKIAASGDNVFIVWQDTSFGSTEILFASSTDNGITFGNPVRLTNTPATASNSPNIAATSNFAHVVWEENVSGNFQVFYSTGIPPTISFNATTFRTYDDANISITSSSSNTNSATSQTIIAQITSDSDLTGISLVLTETDVNTGIFEAPIDFTSGISSGTTLKAIPGDVITATFDGSSATASIFPIVISFDFITYDLGDSAIITITDQNSNVTTSRETITGTITSDTFPGGVSLSFTETGPKTGIFQNTYLIFMTGNDLFSFTDNVKISQFENSTAQTTDNTVTTLQVDVDSTTAPGVLGLDNLVLTETGPNTGQFEETITFTSLASSGTSLQAATGDIISVTYNGATSNGLITPTNSTIGALQASIGDTITASFGVSSDTADIIPGAGGGGGGGGLIRPGLVVDAVAGVSLFGSGGGNIGQGASPTFNPPSHIVSKDYIPIFIDGNSFTFDDTGNIHPISDTEESVDEDNSKTVKIIQGKDIQIKFKMYSPLGKDHIQHVAFYTNTKEKNPQDVSSSTAIIYDKDKDLKIFNGMKKFSNANMVLVEKNDYVTIILDINFDDTMEKSDIVLKIWDVNRFSFVTHLEDVIEVVNVSEETVLSDQPLSKISNKQESSPLNSMTREKIEQIKQTINEWGGFSSQSASDSELLEDLGIEGTKIPQWFKKTARWVNNEQITLDDFIVAVNYLSRKNLLL